MARRNRLSAAAYLEGILAGDRTVLSQAITLVESTHAEDRPLAEELVENCLPHTGKAFRVGISGPPGVGKSTFVEALGLAELERGRQLAVLAIDPSSQRSHGSILGDKTRMERLTQHPNAFVRPSPAGWALGGVNHHTRETLLLCEAAGFDRIWIETVGVGQSETQVKQLTDCFVLLAQPNAGDDLQGIKRGVMELADLIAVNKADGDHLPAARRTLMQLEQALSLLHTHERTQQVGLFLCSALTGEGIGPIADWLDQTWQQMHASGALLALRQTQWQQWFRVSLMQQLEQWAQSRNYALQTGFPPRAARQYLEQQGLRLD